MEPDRKYLTQIVRTVDTKRVRLALKKSADYSRHGASLWVGILKPLESHSFVDFASSDNEFALSNLLIDIDGEALDDWVLLYLASLYICSNKLGVQGAERAVRMALVSMVGSGSDAGVWNAFGDFLMSREGLEDRSDRYFLTLAAEISYCEGASTPVIDTPKVLGCLPAWVGDVKDVRLLSDDPKFPHTWSPLVERIDKSGKIRYLLGAGKGEKGSLRYP